MKKLWYAILPVVLLTAGCADKKEEVKEVTHAAEVISINQSDVLCRDLITDNSFTLDDNTLILDGNHTILSSQLSEGDALVVTIIQGHPAAACVKSRE